MSVLSLLLRLGPPGQEEVSLMVQEGISTWGIHVGPAL